MKTTVKAHPAGRKRSTTKKKPTSASSTNRKRRQHSRYNTRLSTGVDRFDDLSPGGLKRGDDILVAGPNFSGRDVFLYKVLSTQLKKAIPAVIILTESTPVEFSARMRNIYPKYHLYEKRGYVKYLDAYSKSMGLKTKKDPNRSITTVSDLKNLDAWLKDITRLEKSWYNTHEHHILLFNSVHTLYNYFEVSDVNTFLKALSGRTTLLKATSLYDISTDGVQPDIVNQIASFMDAMIEFKVKEGDIMKYYLRVRGMYEAVTDNWVEYTFTKNNIGLVGPFLVEVIR